MAVSREGRNKIATKVHPADKWDVQCRGSSSQGNVPEDARKRELANLVLVHTSRWPFLAGTALR